MGREREAAWREAWQVPTPCHMPALADWGAVEPLEYLSPFLEVIKSPETSGPITAVALTAVNRFLERNILGACWASRVALAQKCCVGGCRHLVGCRL